MSAEQHIYIEQDPNFPPTGNELPTYDDLALQNGPNSRYFTLLESLIIQVATEHLIGLEDGKDGSRRGTIYNKLAWGLVGIQFVLRAAERYADVTPEERARRRERGWGDADGNIVN